MRIPRPVAVLIISISRIVANKFPDIYLHGLIIHLCYGSVMDYMLHPVPQSPLQTAAPKAEFRRGNSNDTFTTSGDGDDDCSLVGADMSLDVQDHDGDGLQSRRNSSLPAMRASAEFANLHDLAAGGNDSDDDADGGDADKAKAASKDKSASGGGRSHRPKRPTSRPGRPCITTTRTIAPVLGTGRMARRQPGTKG